MECVEKLCRLLSDAGFDNAILDTFRENKVDEQVLIRTGCIVASTW